MFSSLVSLCTGIYGWLSRTACNGRQSKRAIEQKNAVCGRYATTGEGLQCPSKYQLTMGLCRSKTSWLRLDDNYVREHEVKKFLLETRRQEVLGCNPVAELAAEEVLKVVVDDLTENYPDSFQRIDAGKEVESVRIVETGETFHLHPSYRKMTALETAGLLAMEDFNILMKTPDQGHTL